MIWAFIAINAVLAGGIAFIGVSGRRPAWQRAAVAWLFVMALGAQALAIELLSMPKPHDYEWRSGKAAILQHHLLEGEAIYMWVLFDNELFPRAYRLPWSEQQAQKLEEGQKQVEEKGGQLTAEFGEQGGFNEETARGVETMSTDSHDTRDQPNIYPEPPHEAEQKPDMTAPSNRMNRGMSPYRFN